MTRGEYGLLIDYEYCSGCHACEVACKKRLGLPEGEFGICQAGVMVYGTLEELAAKAKKAAKDKMVIFAK